MKYKPLINKEMFPKSYLFQFFDTVDFDSMPASQDDLTGFAVCGDWIDSKTRKKEWGVTIYFQFENDADEAALKLESLDWDAWVEEI